MDQFLQCSFFKLHFPCNSKVSFFPKCFRKCFWMRVFLTRSVFHRVAHPIHIMQFQLSAHFFSVKTLIYFLLVVTTKLCPQIPCSFHAQPNCQLLQNLLVIKPDQRVLFELFRFLLITSFNSHQFKLQFTKYQLFHKHQSK